MIDRLMIVPALVALVAPISGLAADPPPGVKAAPAALVKHVSGFLKPGLTLDHAYIAPSKSHQKAQFLAARIVGTKAAPGAGHWFVSVGVWLVSGPADSPGLTLSVNAYAKEFSVAPDGSKTKADVIMLDPQASDLQHYVELQVK